MTRRLRIIGLTILVLFALALILSSEATAGILLLGFITGFAAIAYMVSSRRVTHSFIRFLLRFAVVFIAFLILNAAMSHLFPSVHIVPRDLMAKIVCAVLNLGGTDYNIMGSTIWLEDYPLVADIAEPCLGGILLWLYAALILAVPDVTHKQRILGIFFGFAIIMTFNVVRIAFSIHLEYITGAYVHDYFYYFNIAFVMLVWIGWLWLIEPVKRRLSFA